MDHKSEDNDYETLVMFTMGYLEEMFVFDTEVTQRRRTKDNEDDVFSE